MKLLILLFTLLGISLIPLINAELVYYEKLYKVYKHPVDLLVVDRERDIPFECLSDDPHTITTGCAIYGMNEDNIPINVIYLLEPFLHIPDYLGDSVLHHELKHIKCQCNWHG